jgi:hypothetical protein
VLGVKLWDLERGYFWAFEEGGLSQDGHFASAAMMGRGIPLCVHAAGDGYEGSLKVPIEESESKRRSDEPN